MKMNALIRYHIPPEILALWREREGEDLLPLQEMAVKRHGLFDEQNLLVQAPTSSGKTFIGEMAAIQTALRRKQVVYLVPLKALAEEKYREFAEKYTPYGLKVIISTRDHREFDQDLEDGKFSIAVVVYEKLSQLLVRRPERIEEIALIVADELEILSDPERGGMVEVLLTRILSSSARLLGLSAVIGEADRLAEWMQAGLVTYERRPVELRYGVLHEGTFRYRTYNAYGQGEESLAGGVSGSPWEMLMENVQDFVARGEPCLIFVKAKHESRRGAERLADALQHAAAGQAQEELRDLEPTRSRDGLIETLNSGVAFHNADLSTAERRIVEQGFRAGEILVVVSTSTLSVGMNLPARNVFIAPDKWRYDDRFGMPWKTPILQAEYENMAGRAGRYGAGHEFGRAILIAATPFDYETLWRRYIEGERERIVPQLAREPLESPVLRLVASKMCRTEPELYSFLERTLTGQWVWLESLTVEECEFRIHVAVNRAVDAGVMVRQPDGSLAATPFGLAVAAKGIGIATASELAHWIGESETRHWSPIDAMLAAATTPDGRLIQVMLTANEYDRGGYVLRLKRLTEDENIGADVPLNRIRNSTLMPFFEEVRAIKAALFLNEWIEHAALRDIEDSYHTMAGQILTAADQLSWIIDAIAAIAVTLGACADFVSRLETLAVRLARGLREEVLPLARGGGRTLSRNEILSLVALGLHTKDALREAPIQVLETQLPKTVAHALKAWAGQASIDTACADAVEMTAMPGSPQSPILVVDDRRPDAVVVEGQTVRLQEKQYRLVRLLAASPGECVPYDTIYQAVWGQSIVEPNQMHFQKRKLLTAVAAECPDRADLVTTIPKRGFVLNLAPGEVHLTEEAVACVG